MKDIDVKPLVNLLRTLLSEMVLYPQHLVIEPQVLTASATITIQGHMADTPILIGGGGENYKAIVSLATAIGARAGYRVTVPSIRDPVIGSPEFSKFQKQDSWPKARIKGLLGAVVWAVFVHPDSVVLTEHEDFQNSVTTIEVVVARQENPQLVGMMAPVIFRIFDAIGKAHGHFLKVDVIRDREPAQPDFSDGRHAGQIKR